MGRRKKTHKRIFVPLQVYAEILDGFENYDEVSIEAIMENPMMIKEGYKTISEKIIKDNIKELKNELKNFDNNFGDCVRNQEYIRELEIKIEVLENLLKEEQ